MDPLIRIKRLAIARKLQFTDKAETERLRDGLSVEDVVESLVNASAITKTLGSRAPGRSEDRLYVIESPNFSGLWIYTKGTIRKVGETEVFYVLVSSKRSR
ncbi:MAG: hypothetical protein HYY13_01970 [Nitrospirae bacterium]|nr:hypothetical protein [Nitrospirota bacterium]